MGFQDLEVWQLSHDFAVEIYKDFKTCKDYSFVDQIKRAVVSISNNIAEGAERNTSIDFAPVFLISLKVPVAKSVACYF